MPKTNKIGTTHSKLIFFKDRKFLVIQGKSITITCKCKNKNAVYAHLERLGYKKVSEWENENLKSTAKVKRI